MKKHILLAAVASLALTPAAFAQSNKAGAAQEQAQLSPADQTFITKAGVGGMFEVQSSELAEDKAQSAEVKTFAKQMVKDHGKANGELESLGKKLGADIPQALDAKHAATLKKLEGAEGAAFDAAYVQAQRAAHKEAVSLFQSQASARGNPELASWAQKTLPVLKQHQGHIQNINPGVAQGDAPSNMGRSSTGMDQPPRQ